MSGGWSWPVGASASRVRRLSSPTRWASRDPAGAYRVLDLESSRPALSSAPRRARWRFSSWTPRRVAAELSAQTQGRGPRARLTWRSWAGDASQDDGVLEVEASAPRAPLRVRLGAAGLGSDKDRAARRETYGILD